MLQRKKENRKEFEKWRSDKTRVSRGSQVTRH